MGIGKRIGLRHRYFKVKAEVSGDLEITPWSAATVTSTWSIGITLAQIIAQIQHYNEFEYMHIGRFYFYFVPLYIPMSFDVGSLDWQAGANPVQNKQGNIQLYYTVRVDQNRNALPSSQSQCNNYQGARHFQRKSWRPKGFRVAFNPVMAKGVDYTDVNAITVPKPMPMPKLISTGTNSALEFQPLEFRLFCDGNNQALSVTISWRCYFYCTVALVGDKWV